MTSQSAITVVCALPEAVDLGTQRNVLAHLGVQLDRACGVRASRPHDHLLPLPADVAQAVRVAANQLKNVLSQGSIHFLSFFIIDHSAPGEVLLEVNCDGDRARCLRDLAIHAEQFLRLLFGRCEGFRSDSPAQLERFLRTHDRGAHAFYVGCPGRTVRQIGAEQKLRAHARDALPGTTGESAAELWMKLRGRARTEPELAALLDRPEPRPLLVRWGLNPEGARKRLRSAVGLLFLPLLTVLGLYGYGSALLPWPPAEPWRIAFALAPLVLTLLVTLFTFVREAPVHGRRARALRSFVRPALAYAVTVAVVFGLLALALRGAYALPLELRSLAIGVAGAGVLLVFAGLLYVLVGAVTAVVFPLFALGAWIAHVALHLSQPRAVAELFAKTAVPAALLLAAVIAGILVAIRRAELRDPDESNPPPLDLDRLDRLTELEDWGLQNHLATVTPLKPGRLRRYALGAVLRLISIAARTYFNHGRLATIRCIHFGRFVILENPARLLFIGNYDGGFAAYLGAFSSVLGTTAVWSNTQGLPRSYYLAGEGARDEQRFKAFGRRSQVPTLGWFSAYPTLSVQDIDAATATREALARAVGPRRSLFVRLGALLGLDPARELAACGQSDPSGGFEQRFTAVFRDPIDEAGCDAALRRL
jgi:hypothetical protein